MNTECWRKMMPAALSLPSLRSQYQPNRLKVSCLQGLIVVPVMDILLIEIDSLCQHMDLHIYVFMRLPVLYSANARCCKYFLFCFLILRI